MNIKQTDSLNVKNVEQKENKIPKITLEHKIQKWNITTIGAILECQYKVGNQYLLFISEDSPYEEGLHIVLLSHEGSIKDIVELSANYSPGMLRNISIVQPDSIQFSFFENEETWTLKVLKSPKTFIWGNKFPVKRKSPVLHKTWIILKKS